VVITEQEKTSFLGFFDFCVQRRPEKNPKQQKHPTFYFIGLLGPNENGRA